MKAKCKDCEHFHIIQGPLKIESEVFDQGEAECLKHNLIVSFTYYGKLDKIECVDNPCED